MVFGLRQAEEGTLVAEVCRKMSINEQPARNAGAKVVRENIGLGDELLDALFPLGGLKVNLDAFLASVGMRLGVTAPRWRPLAHHIVGKCPGMRGDVDARRPLQVY